MLNKTKVYMVGPGVKFIGLPSLESHNSYENSSNREVFFFWVLENFTLKKFRKNYFNNQKTSF